MDQSSPAAALLPPEPGQRALCRAKVPMPCIKAQPGDIVLRIGNGKLCVMHEEDEAQLVPDAWVNRLQVIAPSVP